MPGEQVFKLYTDGGARGNPGPAALGIVLVDSSGTIIKQVKRALGVMTNNQAEYNALIEGLKLAAMYWKGKIECISDSELLVRQLTGKYQVKNTELKALFSTVHQLEKAFHAVIYKHVNRSDAQVAIADKLVNEALDESS
nr:ribonuclease HI family protein [Candidatus Sigynarchaeota archaeon]